MGVINMAKNLKQIHPDFVICYKVGKFYNSFGKDACIISYLFEYSTRKAEQDIISTGFPKNALPKVMSKLEKEKLNYLIIDTRNNYNVDEESDNKNLNRYHEISKKAQKYVKYKRRIDEVKNTLIKNIEKEEFATKFTKIEEILYGK